MPANHRRLRLSHAKRGAQMNPLLASAQRPESRAGVSGARQDASLSCCSSPMMTREKRLPNGQTVPQLPHVGSACVPWYF